MADGIFVAGNREHSGAGARRQVAEGLWKPKANRNGVRYGVEAKRALSHRAVGEHDATIARGPQVELTVRSELW